MLENLKVLRELLHPTRSMREQLDGLCPMVRKYLSDTPRDQPITTNELVERIFPIALAKKDGVLARTRLIQVLVYAAPRDLADCAVRGPQRRMKGHTKLIKPWLWSESGERNEENAALARHKAEIIFKKSFAKTFGYAVRRLGFVDAKRLADAVIAVYDDPTMDALEAGNLANDAELEASV